MLRVYLDGQVPHEIPSLELPVEATFLDLKTLINDKVGISSSVQILSMKGGGLVKDYEHTITYAFDGILHVTMQRTDAIWPGGMKRKLESGKHECPQCRRIFHSKDIFLNHLRQCKRKKPTYASGLLQSLVDGDTAKSSTTNYSTRLEDPPVSALSSNTSLNTRFDDMNLHGEMLDVEVPGDEVHEDNINSTHTSLMISPEGKGEWNALYDDLIIENGQADFSHIFQKAVDSKLTSNLPVTSELMDDLEFANVAKTQCFTRQQSSSVLNFIRTSKTDLSSLCHPDSAMRKVQRMWGGTEKWEKKEISLKHGEAIGLSEDTWKIEIEYRQLSSAIDELLAAVGSVDNVKIRFERPNDGISEAFHSEKFRRTQEFLYPNIGEKDCPIQVMLFLDESHCDEKGNLVACPLLMSLANFTLETMGLQDAITVLMYVPIVQSTIAEKSKELSYIKQSINDACMEIILGQIEATQDNPIAVTPFNNDLIYTSKVAVHCFSIDTKAANELTHHSQGWNANMPFRICKKQFSDLLKRPFVDNFRTKSEDQRLRTNGSRKLLKQFSIKEGRDPFAVHDRALGDTQGHGKSTVFPPEPLHQHDGGEEKVTLVCVMLILPH